MRAPLTTITLLAAVQLGASCATDPADRDVIRPTAPDRVEDPGRVTVRRLNSTEYNNTVRDLLFTELRPADLFPTDDVAGGWDHMGDALTVSPLHVEMYEQAAQQLVATELSNPAVEPATYFYEGESDEVEGTTGAAYADFYNLWSRGSLTAVVTVANDGTYALTASLGATQGGPDLAQAALQVDGFDAAIVDVTGEREFNRYSTEVTLTRGVHTIGVAFLNDFYDPDLGEDRNLLVDWFELEGPTDAVGEPSLARTTYYTCDPAVDGEESCATEVLTGFATKAWRRPPDADGLAMLTGLYELARDEGADWEQAVATGLEATLLSSRFLFRPELDDAPTSPDARALDGYELASRLSYFLWRTMPDDRLMALADDGTLLVDDVLEAEVRRMLEDPRRVDFVDDFTGQWLNIRAISNVEPDYALFPAFDDALRQSMQGEVAHFAADIFLNDRPMLDLLTSDETWVDARLAEHYGIEPPSGRGFSKVVVDNHPRVGLMGKAGLLTSLSFPKRTSPVKRGQWVMDNLLCEAPPPAPAAVEGLPEDSEGKSLRERMAQHRTDPACATCHRVMDPIGFSMEKYDAVGAWRDTYQDGSEIETSDSWPGGPEFADAEDLSYALAEDSRVPRCMVQKAFSFALARPAGIEDLPYLNRIETDFAAGEYRFSDLAVAIALSEPFRYRRGEPEVE